LGWLKGYTPEGRDHIVKKAFWTGFFGKTAEEIPGGKASGHTPEEFNKKDLKKGIKIEKEHTKNKKAQKEIVMDHIIEVDKKDSKGKYTSPYYDEMGPFEKKVEKKASFQQLWFDAF
jgi:hypothetical protein